MPSIHLHSSEIVFGRKGFLSLSSCITDCSYNKLFILTDSNTVVDCLPYFLQHLATECVFEIIEIEAGEVNKNIETCMGVWQTLSELGADRKSALIALGGGVVTDLGGFVASTFKRGIDFYLVPTSLLAMVDASIGGKTGVDLGVLKNEVGMFAFPKAVLVDAVFLETLPTVEMKSGLAEMLKHGLIADAAYWNELIQLEKLTTDDLERLIFRSVEIKKNIVSEDPSESGVRKILNFGHSLGHAIESCFLGQQDRPVVLHGFAVAAGMSMEAFLSFKKGYLSFENYLLIKTQLKEIYGIIDFSSEDVEVCLSLLQHDKKNENGQILFSLLNDIGGCFYNQEVEFEWLLEAFQEYQN